MTLLDSHFAIGFGINGPLWLLSIVVTFYAVLPFVARRYSRHPLVGLALAAAVTIAWKQTVDWAPEIFERLSSRAPDVGCRARRRPVPRLGILVRARHDRGMGLRARR